jgi:hypothetical protein
MGRFDAPISVIQVSTPSQPGSGYSKLYSKTDGRWYTANSSVAETPLTPLSAKNSSDQASISTLADLTNLGIAITAGTWTFRWVIFYNASGSGVGMQVALNGPTLTSLSMAVWTQQSATSALRAETITAYNTAGASAASATATVLPIYMEGIVTVSASGTLQPRAQSSSGTVTCKANSFGRVWAF